MSGWGWNAAIIILWVFTGGMLFGAVVLNLRVDACEARSPSGRCVIDISSDGINLLPAHLSSKGNKE